VAGIVGICKKQSENGKKQGVKGKKQSVKRKYYLQKKFKKIGLV